MSSLSSLVSLAKSAQEIARRKRRGNNLFDLAFRYKDYGGSGRIYTRDIWKKHWTTPNKCDCFWIVDKVVETCRSPVTNKGKAWGWFIWKGKYFHLGERRRVRRTYKRDWRELSRDEVDIPPFPQRNTAGLSIEFPFSPLTPTNETSRSTVTTPPIATTNTTNTTNTNTNTTNTDTANTMI